MAFVSDTFTDTATTLLTSHTGETGATWTSRVGTSNLAVISNANRVRSNAAGGGRWTASGSPAAAEYDITCDVYCASAINAAGPLGRFQVGTNYTYLLWYDAPGTRWALFEVTGSNTLLGSYTQTLSAGVTYSLRFQIRDATKKVFVDGVERISSSTNVITGAGLPGLIVSNAATDTTGIHIDNYIASDLGSTVSKTLSDTSTFSDTFARDGIFRRTPAESLAISDALAIDRWLDRNLSDSASFSDAIATDLLIDRILSEVFGFSDAQHLLVNDAPIVALVAGAIHRWTHSRRMRHHRCTHSRGA